VCENNFILKTVLLTAVGIKSELSLKNLDSRKTVQYWPCH